MKTTPASRRTFLGFGLAIVIAGLTTSTDAFGAAKANTLSAKNRIHIGPAVVVRLEPASPSTIQLAPSTPYDHSYQWALPANYRGTVTVSWNGRRASFAVYAKVSEGRVLVVYQTSDGRTWIDTNANSVAPTFKTIPLK
jgi:hypothetical protein